MMTVRRPWVWLSAVCGALLCAAEPAWAQESSRSAFDHFLVDGGWITHWILLPLSLATVALTVDHLIMIRRGSLMPDELKLRLAEQFQARRFKDSLEITTEDPSMLAQVIHGGLARAGQGVPAMQRAMEEVLEARSASLFRRIEYLNIIGNIAPMIGLFGTVFGMIKTFTTIVEQGGQPDAQLLAKGISIALVTTFWGLLVAIPALSIFHIMRNRIDGLVAECAEVAEEFMSVLKPTGRPGNAGTRGNASGRSRPQAAAVASER